MGQIRALIFDFDGVILESVELKLQAAARLFPDHPERLSEALQYWRDNVSLSRYVKLRHIYAHILHQPLTPREEADLGARFGADIARDYLSCPKVEGAVDLLEAYRGRCLMFVASGTPEDELRDVVKAQGLAEYFDGVFGSPAAKPDICRAVLDRWDIDPAEAVMIGDAMLDLEAARAVDIGFVGRAHTAPGVFEGQGVPVVRDLCELRGLLDDRVLSARPGATARATG